jgi:hypothetical protein
LCGPPGPLFGGGTVGNPSRKQECFDAFKKHKDLSVPKISKKTGIPASTLYNWRWVYDLEHNPMADDIKELYVRHKPNFFQRLLKRLFK